MTEERIGGHIGLDVFRLGDGRVKKVGRNEGPYNNILSLKREAWGLEAMEGSGFTPRLLDYNGHDVLIQEDVGDTDEKPNDGEKFRRNCTRALWEIRRRGVRHGDLTSRNIILRDDHPWIIDWQESHPLAEAAPQKRPTSDGYLMFRTVADWSSLMYEVPDTPRTVRRWLAILHDLDGVHNLGMPMRGKRLLDLGTHMGDFVGMGATELMKGVGVDNNSIRDGLTPAREFWRDMPCQFVEADLCDLPPQAIEAADVILMFSVWSYIVQKRGWREAKEVLMALHRNMKLDAVFYFENQLYGDGPGPEALKDNGDERDLLTDVGFHDVEPLVTIPVTDRPHERTVWRCTG